MMLLLIDLQIPLGVGIFLTDLACLPASRWPQSTRHGGRRD